MSLRSNNPYQAPQGKPNTGTSSLVLTLLAIMAILAGCLTVFLGLCVAPLAWILRDGLGPDSTESSGLVALGRMFWTFYWGPAILITSAVLGGALLLRQRLNRAAQNKNSKE